MIKRYDLYTDGLVDTIAEIPEGRFVKYEDYLALEQKLKIIKCWHDSRCIFYTCDAEYENPKKLKTSFSKEASPNYKGDGGDIK